jgi:hypothetical protein
MQLTCILETSRTAEFLATIVQQVPTYREDIMTIAQELRKEGHHEGLMY